jgi:NADP-dependent 3-hydroxy acid dehydrogenase YdfG
MQAATVHSATANSGHIPAHLPRLAQEGASLGLAARTAADLEQVAAEARRHGAETLAVPTDVSDEQSVDGLVAQMLACFGQIDLLVNNAGMATPGAPIHEVTAEDWRTNLEVNTTGTFLCSKAVLPGMIARGEGQIINISSVSGLWRGVQQWVPYAASKWSVVGFTKALDQEVRPLGIRVSVICPGGVDTHFLGGKPGSPEGADKLRPEDVAEAVRFIATQPPWSVIDELVITPLVSRWGYQAPAGS